MIRSPVRPHVRRLPADLTVVLALTVLTNVVVFAPVIRETPLRVAFGLVFILVAPGYALVALVFPERGPVDRFDDVNGEMRSPTTILERPRSWWGTIDGPERIAFSIASSAVIAPVVGFIVVTVQGSFQFGPTFVAVSAVTVALTVGAIWRRLALSPDDRFRVPYGEWTDTLRAAVFDPNSRGSAILNVALVCTILLVIASVGYAATALPQDDEYSTIYVLSEGDADSVLEIPPGESREVVVGVDNRERRATTYTVVVVEQEMDVSENETRVVDQRELDRFESTTDHGETWRLAHDIEPTADGEVRIVWLLYVDGDAPEEPSIESAAYRVHLWVEEGDS
ncbi:DUF1616 domain-containing protein [Natronosalvus halobius]|uniref:DUF1616 domain-containing protein n=1 Tax=Natronosalvus halobius TaxID=2953746 RepID=UPI00209C9104|nr:DUF1616 domain-containing protein [Natronosalvus halobius]USZ72090.1 DUF1616 domain-containing protein [Natronosalvus halobius]